jgi:hypothetical protein
MGYRGKPVERQQARQLRTGLPLSEIARCGSGLQEQRLAVGPRRGVHAVSPRGARSPPRAQRLAAPETGRDRAAGREGRSRIGRLSEREFLVAGVALYAGEGSKRDGAVKFANTNPRMIAFYCAWRRRFFEIDEARLRVRLYLHEGLDLAASVAFWSEVTGIPPSQFQKPYRAVPDPTIRHTKHVHGCVSIDYSLLGHPPQYHGASSSPSLAATRSIRGSSIGRAAAC